ncbi:MAG: MBL fold metallo-hydrolase [Candidatus Aminicenantes bacterium]|nr:MBL fold metallo-hydrolase [Candidatus Aminicenantes bacterium]
MKRWIIQACRCVVILGLAAMAAGNPAGSCSGSRLAAPLQLTYLANEGVLLSCGGTKVLIDAVLDKPHPDYRAPAPDILAKMMKGEAPFDGVDLLLVTHNHPDHFEAPLAAKFMVASAKTVCVAPADAVAELRKAAEWAKIESRVVSLDLKVGEKTSRDIGGIPVKALRTLHSGDREAPMNLVLFIDLGGWRIFHEGDSPEKIEAIRAFGLGSKPVDLALVHFWFPLEPNAAKFLQEELAPDHIALMHLPIRLESDAPGKIDQVRKYYKDIFLLLPGMPAKEFRK